MKMRPPLDRDFCARAAAEKRKPSWLQTDKLHLEQLNRGLSDGFATIANLKLPAGPALDLFCGTGPYRDQIAIEPLFTADIDFHFSVPNVICREQLPFADGSLALVVCTQALYLVEDDQQVVEELRRVLRPGGAVLITVPAGHRKDLRHERDYSQSQLEELFDRWQGVDVRGFGGIGTRLSYNLLHAGKAVARRLRLFSLVLAVAAPLLNAIGVLLDTFPTSEPAIHRLVAVAPENEPGDATTE